MARNRKGRTTHGHVSGSATERIAWLLNQLWNTNQSAMASAIGCSQSVLSRVIAGKQKPGRELLQRVAAVPRVNPAWLLSGEGEPLLAESDMDSLPMSGSFLPGDPAKYREWLQPTRFPVPAQWFRPSRYWLVIAPAVQVLDSNSAKVLAGDLLLMETDVEFFRTTFRNQEPFAVVRFFEDGEPLRKLCRIWQEEGSQSGKETLFADTFDAMDGTDLVTRTITDTWHDGTIRKRRTYLRRIPSKKGRRGGPLLKPVSASWRPEQAREITWSDVVGVALVLLRNFGLD
jgi:hypothetical protein